MNNQDYNDLREISWQRDLTPAEQAQLQSFLKANPAIQAEWQEDLALNQMLRKLPAAPPVSSNFTAQVLAATRLETAKAEREHSQAGKTLWHRATHWLPRLAFLALALGVASIGYHAHQSDTRIVMARNVAELTQAVASDPQLLEDFNAIRQLGKTQPVADTEILALMK